MDKVKVKNIVLVTGEGADCLRLYLDLPNPEYPFTGEAAAKINVAKNSGRDFAIKHFPNTPIRIICE